VKCCISERATHFNCNLKSLCRWYINATITILDIIHLLPFFKPQLNFIGLSLPHRKHITSPLQAHQVDAIYRFVTMVY
jgi:hypothetical protein